MMKLTVTIIFTLFFTTILFAQDYYGSSYEQKSVSLGITVSPNFHWLRYDDEQVEMSSKIGFTYGLLSDFYLAENYAFSTGFLINNLNASSNFNAENKLVQNNYKLQYIEIPFGLKMQSTPSNQKNFYGQFGFTAGMKISGKVKEDNSSKKNLGSDADVFRLGLQVGGGVNWQLDEKLKLMTGLSLNNGFTRILKNGEPKNSYLSLNLAIFF